MLSEEDAMEMEGSENVLGGLQNQIFNLNLGQIELKVKALDANLIPKEEMKNINFQIQATAQRKTEASTLQKSSINESAANLNTGRRPLE